MAKPRCSFQADWLETGEKDFLEITQKSPLPEEDRPRWHRPVSDYDATSATFAPECRQAGLRSGGFRASTRDRPRDRLQIDNGLLDLVPNSARRWFPDRGPARVRSSEASAPEYPTPSELPRTHSCRQTAVYRLAGRIVPRRDYKYPPPESDRRLRFLPVPARCNPGSRKR